MAAIVINNLSVPSQKALYRDIVLDLKIDYTKNTQLEKRREIKDLQISENLGAIKNSLFNLFTTMPGQKILNPLFGLNLTQYLFTAISTAQARIIGESIVSGVRKFEPRILLRTINVEPVYEENQYNVFMIIDVPSLNIQGQPLQGILSESGYYFD